MKKIFLIILLIYSFSGLYSQSKSETVQIILNHIYSCNFDSSKIFINQLIKNNPNDPESHFYAVLNAWWKINIDKRNEKLDDEFNEKINEVIEICDDKLDNNSNDFNALLFKGGSLGYRGLVKSLREKWLSAADDGKQALNLLDEALKINSQNKEAMLGIGIYNYFAEYVPSRYPYLKPLLLLFPKGDKIKGLAQIKEASLYSSIANNEANYILAYLNLNYEKNFVESENYSLQLNKKYPANPIFDRFLNSSYIGLGKFEDALNGWSRIRKNNKENISGYNNETVLREADYYIAVSLHRLNRIEEVSEYLNECEYINNKLDKDENSFKVFTYLLQGMYFDAIGNRGKALEYYNRVLDANEFGNSHEEAKKFIKNPFRK